MTASKLFLSAIIYRRRKKTKLFNDRKAGFTESCRPVRGAKSAFIGYIARAVHRKLDIACRLCWRGNRYNRPKYPTRGRNPYASAYFTEIRADIPQDKYEVVPFILSADNISPR